MSGLQSDDVVFQGLAEAEHNNMVNSKAKLYDEKTDPSGADAELTTRDADYPSDDEKLSLRRVRGPILFSTYLVAVVELVERFSYYGSTVVFTNFIQQPLPPGSTTGKLTAGALTPGALGQGQEAATGLTTFNTFWVYCTPLVGAYVADVHLGRYNAIMVAVAIALVGHIILVVSSLPSVIEHSNGALGAFCIAIIVMGAGTGGFKPNVSTLVAETIESKQRGLHTKVLKSGEKVIVDPALTISSIYMWFYLSINIGALVGQICMVYAERDVGFWLAYTLPTVLFALCPLIMIFGKKIYVLRPPSGSVFIQCMKLCWVASKGRWSWNPIVTIKNMTADDFWESAKPSRVQNKPAWMTYDDAWVDEVRRGFKACTVFTFFPLYWLCYNQINNNLTSQAAVMETHGLPNDILSNLDPFALIILIPICELFFYPALRRAGINFSPLKKICLGFFTGSLAMMCAALVQHNIYKKSPCGYDAASCDQPAPINVWAQTPSYVLIAISEIFASITGLEYAFTLAPKSMRSLVMSVFLFTSAISAALGEAFNPLASDPRLVWNYGVFAVTSFVGGILFWICFHNLDKQHNRLVELKEGVTSQPAENSPHELLHSSVEKGIVPGARE